MVVNFSYILSFTLNYKKHTRCEGMLKAEGKRKAKRLKSICWSVPSHFISVSQWGISWNFGWTNSVANIVPFHYRTLGAAPSPWNNPFQVSPAYKSRCPIPLRTTTFYTLFPGASRTCLALYNHYALLEMFFASLTPPQPESDYHRRLTMPHNLP